ncbi:uncharacterized protein SPAPADRAFT_156121 [Spathaspora passalidarum NRRL Y-27907]|uniref:Interferon-related developmental regulator N-terminal domain-containing protein n=1 Tax=Spathaspora passalidarum (strain NRRL Y-27907 / 11-Y1) TaxID=619300 RepID=G3AT62_SPAPN|nr:uncharacterized protein SPAPADRAFT_156121 [Spathaspora passalidarum NRRL Y-27907]EGW30824.1 hypothetical protein SPAPADRAFT_156121 [Spathaspora passalidarum NRRL Y-27907]
MSRRHLLKRRGDGTHTPKSGASSRAPSAARTPLRSADDSDAEDDANGEQDLFKLEELLREKLANLQQAEVGEMNKEDRISVGDRRQYEADSLNKFRIQSEATGVTDIIVSLSFSRADVSSSSRELLLAQLYKVIISRPLSVVNEENAGTANYVDEDKVSKLISIFNEGDYRSDFEFLYLYKSIIALLCSDIDDFSTLISTDFLAKITQLLVEPATSIITNENKANIISGYVVLNLILHHGASAFGIEDQIAMLMELAEGYTASSSALKRQVEMGDREHATFITDKNMDKRLIQEANSKVTEEAGVAIAALHGVACFLTLLTRGTFLNDILQDLMIKLVPILDNDENRDIAKAAARAIGVVYEMFDYDEEESEDEEPDMDYNVNSPYYEQESLFAILERLTNLSSKKVSKRDKKEINSIFRNIKNTVESYVDPKQRVQIYKRSPEGIEILGNTIDSTSIKLSKYKVLRINTWCLHARLRHLRWCFSFGLHNQLISDDGFQDILKEPENEYNSYGLNHDEIDDSLLHEENAQVLHEYLDYKHSADEKTRKEKRKKERRSKLNEHLQSLALE